ncbi:MAG: hypothetical protein ACRESU_06335 [Gammaproteobacteria bacterium]
MTDVICPDGQCRAQRDGLIVFRDSQHMTASFTKTLDRQFARHLQSSYHDHQILQGLFIRE